MYRMRTTTIFKVSTKAYSYKISFNELFFQVFIMAHFKHFKYAWFFDTRGRTYPDASALNYYNPFARIFLSFYNPVKLTNHHKYQVNKKLKF
jgi:hypothetical protein